MAKRQAFEAVNYPRVTLRVWLCPRPVPHVAATEERRKVATKTRSAKILFSVIIGLIILDVGFGDTHLFFRRIDALFFGTILLLIFVLLLTRRVPG